MENTRFWVEKRDHGKKDPLSVESSALQLKKLAKMENFNQSQNGNVFPKDLFPLFVHGHYKIPKLMACSDETYLRRCLEFLQINALKASQHKKPVSLGTKNRWTSTESLNSVEVIDGAECGSGQLVIGHHVAAVTENLVVSTNDAKNWTLGTLMKTKSMINILNSPLLLQFGASERNDNLNMNFTDAKNMICYDFMDSPSGFSISSSCKPEMETPMVQSHEYGSISVHKRITSTSSTNINCLHQGMLQCTWKQGVPHFVFSADDHKEVYITKLSKVYAADDEALHYVYLIYLNKGGQKGREIPDRDLQLVGKMNVSTCFTLCPDNYRVMETQFTLFGNIKIYDKEMYTSSHSLIMKNKGMSKSVSKVFRTSPSSKYITSSKFSRPKATRESCPLEPQSCGLGVTDFLGTNVPSNFELAAIVVKHHLPIHSLDKVGGWGLKFLNKAGVNQTTLPSESCSCSQNTGDCSTSMSFLIPAGLHGGPTTKHGGPSSLVDRWRSGGSCDCGGWDEGCPLTVFQRRSSNEEVLYSQADMQGKCKSVDLVTQGSSNFSPTLRMVNVHDGLYFIHFLPSLSALQSFSIAVAIIHEQNPTLWPNSAQEL
ncbi:uncharacterized protein LOC113873708 [Abrus precatorius]|uniref:Uncharacterized protein LOC113873708 n=1 Tax=Abrus precatorius TaxID=3816 RepID=A0A8B8MJJ8_ABRPR|nr:uncharacterized protein LOC113873708 [Abrus precatorius]